MTHPTPQSRLSTTERLIALIIGISATVWLVDAILGLTIGLARPLANSLGAYPAGYLLMHQPWGIATYAWVHSDLGHLGLGMIILYFVGSLYERQHGGQRLVWLGVLGALGGWLSYSIGYQLLVALGVHRGALPLLGASAGIYAIAFALLGTTPLPRLELGRGRSLPLGVILVGMYLLDLILKHDNLGGQLAHTGGVIVGLLWGYAYRHHGIDLTELPRRRWHSLLAHLKRKRTPKATQDITPILDKIRQSGYASLNPEERTRLHDTSPSTPDQKSQD